MKVRALVDHSNSFGKSAEKKKGATYEIPDERDAQILIAAGIVEARSEGKG